MDVPEDQKPEREPRKVSEAAWSGYLKNLGLWTGNRALTNCRGKVLIDLPNRVTAERYKTNQGDHFILWRTAVRTADGVEEVEDEWSRSELAEFGALAADGCFTVGAQLFNGEAITIDQCVMDNGLRVRTTHAFDWEGCLSGVIANRESFSTQSLSDGATAEESQRPGFIEPVAWRSPHIFFDYLLGQWEGRGICVDARTGQIFKLTSRFKISQNADMRVTESSILRIGDGGPTRVFEATGSLDTNFILFTEANVQRLLLPGGVFVSAPIRIRRGRPFTVETAFLVKPDSCKRVLRLYNRELEWVNTVFINERRTA